MSVAWAIRHWDFRGLAVKQFWGLPYTMAMVSSITGISDRASLLVPRNIHQIGTHEKYGLDAEIRKNFLNDSNVRFKAIIKCY